MSYFHSSTCVLYILLTYIQVVFAQDSSNLNLDWIDSALRLLAALGLCSLVGLEREHFNRLSKVNGVAGLRTHTLIGLGGCLLNLISIYGYVDDPNTKDPARLAAQAVNGIGFLGAGAIWVASTRIRRGLTTATTIYFSLSIGLACGAGYLVPACFATVFGLASMIVFGIMTKKIQGVYEEYDAQTIESTLLCQIWDPVSGGRSSSLVLRSLVRIVQQYGGLIIGTEIIRLPIQVKSQHVHPKKHTGTTEGASLEAMAPPPLPPFLVPDVDTASLLKKMPSSASLTSTGTSATAPILAGDTSTEKLIDPSPYILTSIEIHLLLEPNAVVPALLDLLERFSRIRQLVLFSDSQKFDAEGLSVDQRSADRMRSMMADSDLAPIRKRANQAQDMDRDQVDGGSAVKISWDVPLDPDSHDDRERSPKADRTGFLSEFHFLHNVREKYGMFLSADFKELSARLKHYLSRLSAENDD